MRVARMRTGCELLRREPHFRLRVAHVGVDVRLELHEVLLEHRTSLRAVSSNSALFCQVLNG